MYPHSTENNLNLQNLQNQNPNLPKEANMTSIQNPLKDSFSDPAYFQKLPRYRKNFSSRIDETKTLLFRLGRNPIYTDDAFLYIGHQNNKPYFCNVNDINDAEPTKIEFDSDLKKLISGNVVEDIKKVGWIVLDGPKWGFLLDLSSLEEVYKGHIPLFWQRLLKFDFFIEQFRRFAFYYQQELNTDFKEIPSTEIDEPIPASFCSLVSRLFLHQRQEVGWMFGLENNPVLLIPGKIKETPFLDTGYYLDPKDHTKLITGKEVSKAQINMPGGILASQVGSGKTVSVIGLLTIGSEMYKEAKEAPKEKCEEEEKKMSDKPQKDVIIEDKGSIEDLKVMLTGRYDPSLVVVTKNILYQWKQELEEFAPGLKVFMLEKWEQLQDLCFEKQGKEVTLKDYDVVLTHRKIIEEGNKMFPECSPLIYSVRFRRVVYDEFHELITQSLHQQDQHASATNDVLELINMKDFTSCIKNIKRDFTWGVTGSPDNLEFHKHTKILFGLLGLDQQYNNINIYQTLRNTFVKNFMRSNPCKVNLKPLDKSLSRVSPYQIQNLLYKGKLNYATNEKEAQLLCSHLLPQYRSLENEPDNIELAAKAIELKHQEEIKKVQSKLTEEEKKEEKKDEKNTKILEERLGALEEEGNFYMEMSRMLMEPSFECPICYANVDNEKLVVTGCIHQICVECYKELIKSVQNPQCPLCKDYLVDNELIIHPRYRGKKENKLTVIEKAIQETPSEDKIIIYTQFHSLVERLEEIFSALNIRYMVLRGQPSEINIALNKFKSVPDIKILLMSIEQSASGINVTAANHVFFAHPIFGMSFEKAALTYNQCIGRAHRIGQNKKVFVKMFVTSESLEDDMVPSFYKY